MFSSLSVWAAAAGNLDPVQNGAQPRYCCCRELGLVPSPGGPGNPSGFHDVKAVRFLYRELKVFNGIGYFVT